MFPPFSRRPPSIHWGWFAFLLHGIPFEVRRQFPWRIWREFLVIRHEGDIEINQVVVKVSELAVMWGNGSTIDGRKPEQGFLDPRDRLG